MSVGHAVANEIKTTGADRPTRTNTDLHRRLADRSSTPDDDDRQRRGPVMVTKATRNSSCSVNVTVAFNCTNQKRFVCKIMQLSFIVAC